MPDHNAKKRKKIIINQESLTTSKFSTFLPNNYGATSELETVKTPLQLRKNKQQNTLKKLKRERNYLGNEQQN